MERRIFFNRLAAIIAGAAIAPRVVAELGPDPAKVHERIVDIPGPFTIDDENALLHYERPSNLAFFGERIMWTNTGHITCIYSTIEGVRPRINDRVLLYLLDDHHLGIMAQVTKVDLHIVEMVTVSADVPQKMRDLASVRLEKELYYGGSPITYWRIKGDEWTMQVRHKDAFVGLYLYSAFSERDYRIYPLTFKEAYREK